MRLGDDPLDTLKHVLSLNPQGHAAEFGVYTGATLRMIADHMPVTGFDSFDGLPEDWREGFEKGRFACPVPAVPNADIVVGLFADTLPDWTPPDQLGLVHIDCDLYSSTKTVLDHLERFLTPGCFIVFDEFHGYPGAGPHVGEWRAWREFVLRTGIEHEPVGHGPEQWATRIV